MNSTNSNVQHAYRSYEGYANGLYGSYPQSGQQLFSSSYLPATPSYNAETGYLSPVAAEPAKKGFNFNFKDLQGMIDRMGGIEGVLDKMGKLNKLMSNFQQMAPMIKVLLTSFGKKNTVDEEELSFNKPRRKRRRRRKTTAARRKRRRT